jgi:hypothetical protein
MTPAARLGCDVPRFDLPIGVDFDDRKLSLCALKADPFRPDFLRVGKGVDCHKL